MKQLGQATLTYIRKLVLFMVLGKRLFSDITLVIFSRSCWGWSGDAKVQGKLPVPERPTIWITVGQGPTALAVGQVEVVLTFLLSSILSFLFLPLFGRRPDMD